MWAVSVLNVSPLTQTIVLMWGSDPCFSGFSHPLRAGPILLTLLFLPLVPLSYQVLCGSIYYFPLVSYSCPLSAGVRFALLCLKVYSWCIHGQIGTSHPPILPSCFCNLYFDLQLIILLFVTEGEWRRVGLSKKCNGIPEYVMTMLFSMSMVTSMYRFVK